MVNALCSRHLCRIWLAIHHCLDSLCSGSTLPPLPLPTHSFLPSCLLPSFIRLSVCAFIHSFISSFLRSFVHPFTYIHTFIHPFLDFSVHSYIQSLNAFVVFCPHPPPPPSPSLPPLCAHILRSMVHIWCACFVHTCRGRLQDHILEVHAIAVGKVHMAIKNCRNVPPARMSKSKSRHIASCSVQCHIHYSLCCFISPPTTINVPCM